MPAGVSQAFRDRSREDTGMQVQTEEDQEVFSDAEIELLLQKKAGKRASAETDAAELKLKLLAYQEIAEQFQQEGSTVLHRETLQKITKLLAQDSFLYSRRLAEYQQADARLSEIIAGSDNVTKNMLLEKAEEYQNLFYRYISADHTKQETILAGEGFGTEQRTASDEQKIQIVQEVQIKQKTISALEKFQRVQETISAIENFKVVEETVSALENSQVVQETAADEMLQVEYPAEADDGMLWMRVVQSGEYKTLFSDRELALLLQHDEAGRMNDSEATERKVAEYKLDLLMYRETVHRILQETVEKEAAEQEVQQKEVQRNEVLQEQKASHEVYQKEILHKMRQLLDQVPFIKNAREALKEYQAVETQLIHILSDCDEITKNVLQEKVREYLELEDQAVKIKEADTAVFSDAERKLPRQAGDGLVSEERQAAEQKLRLLAYRETAKQLLEEDRTVLQREKLQEIARLFSGSGRQMEPLVKETVRNVFDIRGILEHGSLPERKLLFLTAEKTVDELLIRLQEAGNDDPEDKAEQAAEYAANRQLLAPRRLEDGITAERGTASENGNRKKEHIRDLVRLKNQLMQVNGQVYRGADDWGFLLTNEVSRELLRIMQQDKNSVMGVWKQKVQQSLTDFYHHLKEEEFRSQVSENSSFFAKWNPVFRQDEWRQLRSMVNNQPGREHPGKWPDHRNLPDQTWPENAFQNLQPEQHSERRSFRKSTSLGQSTKQKMESVSIMQNPVRKLEHMSTGRNTDRELEFISMEQSPEQKLEHVLTGKSIERELESVSTGQSSERKLEHASIVQNIERELKAVFIERGEKMRQAIPEFRYLQNKDFYYSTKLLQKDIWLKVPDRVQPPAQYQAFMQPPVQDTQSRLPVKAAAIPTQQRTEDTAVWHVPGEQTTIIHTQQHTKDSVRLQRAAEEKEQQQKQELQRLEGSLLDYCSELQAKTAQLDQVEKKLAAQDKELKLVRDSQHTVRKQGKTAAERRQMFNQLKAELQLERMRSGLV